MDEKKITIDVRTDYPHRFEEGALMFDRDGFLIGVVTDSVVQ